ncbi:MAG: GNAT family N-acetyltransferase [Rhodospirillaceae bacterium]|jgi:N-acetylglutamate synthase-like GNAT family acetyltransferase
MTKIKIIEFNSKSYNELLKFRFCKLRKPLGLLWSKQDLKNENNQIHFALIKDKKIIGSCVLKKINNKKARIRQMAIEDIYRNKGYGKKILNEAENYAKINGFKEIMLTARVSAKKFYLKNGYKEIGEVFIDVTVESIMMLKELYEKN